MLLKRFAHAVVMLLVAAGLLLAPLATPALAATVPGNPHHHDMQAMADDASAMSDDVQDLTGDTQTMADDMPCCPGQSGKKDCGSCPFVALCLLSISLPMPSGSVALIQRDAQRGSLAVRNDLLTDGLGAKPPRPSPSIPGLIGADAPDDRARRHRRARR